jgi:hypothetical protein
LYSLPNIVIKIKSRRMRLARHEASHGEIRKAYKILVGKSEGKRLLERLTRKWEDNINMNLREIGCEELDPSGSG